MQCEVCGKNIRGPPKRVVIDTVALFVCGTCARYGVYVPGRKALPILRLTKPTVAKASTNIGQQFEVVPNFGTVIKRAREELGLTQEVLAGLVGEKLSVIKRIEAGKLKPPIELARKIEKVLKVKLVEELRLASEVDKPSRAKIDLTLGDIAIVKDREGELNE